MSWTNHDFQMQLLFAHFLNTLSFQPWSIKSCNTNHLSPNWTSPSFCKDIKVWIGSNCFSTVRFDSCKDVGAWHFRSNDNDHSSLTNMLSLEKRSLISWTPKGDLISMWNNGVGLELVDNFDNSSIAWGSWILTSLLFEYALRCENSTGPAWFRMLFNELVYCSSIWTHHGL